MSEPLTDADLTPELLAIHRKWTTCWRKDGDDFWGRDALLAAYRAGLESAASLVESKCYARGAPCCCELNADAIRALLKQVKP